MPGAHPSAAACLPAGAAWTASRKAGAAAVHAAPAAACLQACAVGRRQAAAAATQPEPAYAPTPYSRLRQYPSWQLSGRCRPPAAPALHPHTPAAVRRPQQQLLRTALQGPQRGCRTLRGAGTGPAAGQSSCWLADWALAWWDRSAQGRMRCCQRTHGREASAEGMAGLGQQAGCCYCWVSDHPARANSVKDIK